MEHDIQFERHGKDVQVAIKTDLPFDEEGKTTRFLLYYNCPNIKHAELLCRYHTARHEDTIRAIRRAEYESGWKDAKGKKRRKSNMFSGLMRQRAINWSE